MSKNQIREFKIGNLIKEAVTLALFEQKLHENDPNMVQPPQQNAGAVPPPPPVPPLDQTQPPAADPNAAPGQQPLTVDSMIERLNVVRGGRSFTDPEIYGQFTSFFKKLAPEQTQVIDQFLQDLSKIVVNVEQQGQTDPATGQPQAPAQQNNSTQGAPISPNPGATQNPAGGGNAGGSMPGM